jgi:hypothetical protein
MNKHGDTIASAVTNLDLHDIARLVRTFDLPTFYVVTPLSDQRKLVERIVSHWTDGIGGQYNPARKEALERICIKNSLNDVKTQLIDCYHDKPTVVTTSARSGQNSLSFERLRNMLKTQSPYLLVLGTAWGLSEEVPAQADYRLEPISGRTEYNHLSVRSAAAIMLDRLVGKEIRTNENN